MGTYHWAPSRELFTFKEDREEGLLNQEQKQAPKKKY